MVSMKVVRVLLIGLVAANLFLGRSIFYICMISIGIFNISGCFIYALRIHEGLPWLAPCSCVVSAPYTLVSVGRAGTVAPSLMPS
jgi:hypothetical protein